MNFSHKMVKYLICLFEPLNEKLCVFYLKMDIHMYKYTQWMYM